MFRSLALEMCGDKSVLPALADIIGLLLCLLKRKAHTTRSGQKLKEIIGRVVSLLLRNSAGSGSRGGRSSRLCNLFHATIIASSKFLVHFQNPLGQFCELATTHVAVLLPQHALEQISLLTDTNVHTAEHLLPAMPDTVVGVLHPAHVACPVTLEAIPAAVESHRSGRTPIAVPERRHRRASHEGWSTDKSTGEAAIAPHGDAIQQLWLNETMKWPGIVCA